MAVPIPPTDPMQAFIDAINEMSKKLGTSFDNLQKGIEAQTKTLDAQNVASKTTKGSYDDLTRSSGKLSKRLEEIEQNVRRYGDKTEQVNRELGVFSKNIRLSSETWSRQLADGSMSVNELRKNMAGLLQEVGRNRTLTQEQKNEQIAFIRSIREELLVRLQITEAVRPLIKGFNAVSSVAAPLATVIMNTAKNIQAASGDFSSAVGVVTGLYKDSGGALSSIGKAATEGGLALGLLGGKLRPFGMGLAGVGLGAQAAGFGLNKFAEVIDFVGKEAAMFVTAFAKANTVGASFATGMEGLRKTAGIAGLTIGDFSEVLDKSKTDLDATGLGVTGGMRVLADASRRLRTGNEGIQLFNLGIVDVKDQTVLLARTMATLRSQGYSQAEAEKMLTTTTVQYAKDLKVLSSITGEDMAKKQKEAELLSTELAVRAALAGNPKAIENFQRAFISLPEDANIRMAFMQKELYGVITDANAAMAYNSSAAVRDVVDTAVASASDLSKNVDKVGLDITDARQRAAANIMKDPGALQISKSARLGAEGMDSLVTTFNAISKGMLQGFGQGSAVASEAEKQIAMQTGITTQMGKVLEDFNTLRTSINQTVTSEAGMQGVFNIMQGGITTMNEFFGKIREWLDKGAQLPQDTAANSFWNFLDNMGVAIAAGVAVLVKPIRDAFSGIGDSLKTAGSALMSPIETLKNVWLEIVDMFVSFKNMFSGGIVSGIKNVGTAAVDMGKNLVAVGTKVVGVVKAVGPGLITLGVEKGSEYAQEYFERENMPTMAKASNVVGQTASGAGYGMLGGAATGALVAGVGAVPGSAIGGVTGGIVGFVKGIYENFIKSDKRDDEIKKTREKELRLQEEAQKKLADTQEKNAGQSQATVVAPAAAQTQATKQLAEEIKKSGEGTQQVVKAGTNAVTQAQATNSSVAAAVQNVTNSNSKIADTLQTKNTETTSGAEFGDTAAGRLRRYETNLTPELQAKFDTNIRTLAKSLENYKDNPEFQRQLIETTIKNMPEQIKDSLNNVLRVISIPAAEAKRQAEEAKTQTQLNSGIDTSKSLVVKLSDPLAETTPITNPQMDVTAITGAMQDLVTVLDERKKAAEKQAQTSAASTETNQQTQAQAAQQQSVALLTTLNQKMEEGNYILQQISQHTEATSVRIG
jgi:hypothetical protein